MQKPEDIILGNNKGIFIIGRTQGNIHDYDGRFFSDWGVETKYYYAMWAS